ncbi:hypothetical protein [Agaribacterium sp. ZY112]|uniref:hypothetical protein n=1 Tax=Agaribacterium sp. ZY112 TaxID=3233574 RepID=UPI003524E23D
MKFKFFALFVLLTMKAYSEDSFVFPEEHSWSAVTLGTSGSPSTFKGTVSLSGILISQNISHPEGDYIRITFQPDSAIEETFPVYVDSYAPKVLSIFNNQDISDLLELAPDNGANAQARATLDISGFDVLIDCNNVIYAINATVLQSGVPSQASLQDRSPAGC